jgi:hypothetical protein
MAGQLINIIIKYAEIDDISFEKKEKGWVSTFADILKSTLKLYTDRRIRMFFKSEVELIDMEEFDAASAVIYVMSPAFIFSSNIRQEISILEKELYFNIELLNSKIFKVLKGPVAQTDIPMTIALGSYYQFFNYRNELDGEYDTVEMNDTQLNLSEIYWNSVSDIIYDLLSIVDTDGENRLVPKESKTMFLGSTVFQNVWYRNRIKRELRDYGVKILPDSDYSVEVKYLDEPDSFYIGKSSLAIHFPDEFAPIENGRVNSIASNPHVNRLIWFNQEIEVDSDKQRFYAELKRTIKNYNHIEIVESNLQELKSIIKDKLFNALNRTDLQFFIKERNKQYVYLITESDLAEEEIEDLKKMLTTPTIDVLVLSEKSDLALRRKMHYEFLVSAEFALIYCSGEHQDWLLSNLKELKKATGYKRNTPLLNYGIITKSVDLKIDLKNQTDNIRHIALSGDNGNTSIEDFFMNE